MAEKRIKVRIVGSEEVKEVTLKEAAEILDRIYNDALGGFVTDARTGRVISKIEPGIEEIVVVEQMLGGG